MTISAPKTTIRFSIEQSLPDLNNAITSPRRKEGKRTRGKKEDDKEKQSYESKDEVIRGERGQSQHDEQHELPERKVRFCSDYVAAVRERK